MQLAIVREVSPSLANCELTHFTRQRIDVGLAQSQHHEYVNCLLTLGCSVEKLAAEPDLPDSVFVEDTAIVLEEVAIITRPGALSRRAETASIRDALAPFRQLKFISSPGTLDGGDVLRIGKDIFIGLSSRTNPAAIDQVRTISGPFGYRVRSVTVRGCLHLKSAVSQVADQALLINRTLTEADAFAGMELFDVDEAEPFAANALFVNGSVIYPTSYPRTRERLERHGISIRPVDVSELIKAEGAVTCCSLIFQDLDNEG